MSKIKSSRASKSAPSSSIQPITLQSSEFQALATGQWNETTAARLNESEYYRRLLHLHTLWQEVESHSEDLKPLLSLGKVMELLHDAERKDPTVVRELLLQPSVGQWLGDTLRLTGKGTDYKNTQRPLWADLGYAHALCAVAAYKTGTDIEIDIPLHNGQAVLPTLGRASLPFENPWQTVKVTVKNSSLVITNDTTSIRVPEYPYESAAGWEGARWLECIASTGEVWQVLLNDFDEFTSLRVPSTPKRLSDASFEGWCEVLGTAWEILVKDHPTQARQIAGNNGLRAIVPAPPKARFQTYSASSGDSPGSATLSKPDNAVEAAVTLIHEHCGHNMLNSLLYMVPMLTNPQAQSKEEYAPWRDDPRPMAGLLHGVKAFSVVVQFWHDRLTIGPEEQRSLAALEFSYWRSEVSRSLRMLRARSTELTEQGEIFLRELQEGLIDPLLEIPIDNKTHHTTRALIVDHSIRWAGYHTPVSSAILDKAATAWLNGSTEPPTELFEDVRQLIPHRTAQGLDVALVLVRLGIVDPNILTKTSLLPQEATPGDIALATSLLTASDSVVNKWIALDNVAVKILEAQRGTPHDILGAIYNRVNNHAKTPPSHQELSLWLAKGMVSYLRRQGDDALLPRYQRQETKQAAAEMLQLTTSRAIKGELSALEATQLLMAQGYLAIGTAKSKAHYTPKIPVTNIPDHEVESGLEFSRWRPRVEGGPIVRASRIAVTAVWAAAIGDPHTPFQRETLGTSFLRSEQYYPRGYGGWYYNSKSPSGGYVNIAHEDLAQAIAQIKPETVIGAVDFLEEDFSFVKEIPFEPGQVASSTAHQTVSSIPVRAKDIHSLLSKVETYNYTPERLK